jgi:hypothetical protein
MFIYSSKFVLHNINPESALVYIYIKEKISLGNSELQFIADIFFTIMIKMNLNFGFSLNLNQMLEITLKNISKFFSFEITNFLRRFAPCCDMYRVCERCKTAQGWHLTQIL